MPAPYFGLMADLLANNRRSISTPAAQKAMIERTPIVTGPSEGTTFLSAVFAVNYPRAAPWSCSGTGERALRIPLTCSRHLSAGQLRQ